MAKKRKQKNTFFNKKARKLLIFILAAIFSAVFVKESTVKEYAQPVIGTVYGTVIKVSDGDTVTIVNSDNKKVKIRLYGIDSPELGQQSGEAAKLFLARQIMNKYITVDVLDIDQYKRSVGRIFFDGADINRAMIEEGFAWVYTRYCNIDERESWIALQEEAKTGGKGLWSYNDPVAPWEWRKRS